MQNNTTKIIAAVIAILALGGIATFALNSNKPSTTDVISKSSEVMTKTNNTAKMEMEKMKKEEMMKIDAMKKEEMMRKDSVSKDVMLKTSEVMTKAGETMSKESDAMTKDGDSMMKKESDSTPKDAMMKSGEVSSPKGVYSQYSVTNLAQNATGTNVIFFHAPWCPSCKAIDAELTANGVKLPEGFQVLKADFDTSTALKQKYGVTGQSTFVNVDKDGNKIGIASAQFNLKTVEDIVAFGSK